MYYLNRIFLSLMIASCFLAAPPSWAKTSKAKEEKVAKDDNYQEQINRLQNEVDSLKKSHLVMFQKGNLLFANRTYVKAGIELLIPHRRTFISQTDTGLGAFVGLGQYFGENHVADLGFEWDLYPAFSLRYRYEFHFSNPSLAFGPVIGYKVKLANVNPWDNFIENAGELKNSFFFAGMMAGFPMQNSMATLELLYLTNKQTFIMMNVGIHFFFMP